MNLTRWSLFVTYLKKRKFPSIGIVVFNKVLAIIDQTISVKILLNTKDSKKY